MIGREPWVWSMEVGQWRRELTFPKLFLCLLQASPAPIIVNTDTLESVPYVSMKASEAFYTFY